MATTTLKGQPFDRQTMDSMLRRRMFYTPSFEIYGGVAGLVSLSCFAIVMIEGEGGSRYGELESCLPGGSGNLKGKQMLI